MSTRLRRLRIPALAITLLVGAAALAACGDDDEPSTEPITSIGTPVTVGASTTGAPADTVDIPVPPPVDTADAPLVIEVTVGVDGGPERIETVSAGSIVTLSITNPTSDDEYHIHGYDLGDGQEIPAGQTATFTFVADQVGDFEVESHASDDQLLVLRVI